ARFTTVPTVFQFGVDPVAAGVVSSFNRPGGNVTGIVNLSVGLIAKRLELVRQLVPEAKLIAVLLNPNDTAVTASEKDDIGNARATLGVQLEVLGASTIPGIETAFVLERRPCTARQGLWPWIEQASKRLQRNMLAIALANKLARIAWAV